MNDDSKSCTNRLGQGIKRCPFHYEMMCCISDARCCDGATDSMEAGRNEEVLRHVQHSGHHPNLHSKRGTASMAIYLMLDLIFNN